MGSFLLSLLRPFLASDVEPLVPKEAIAAAGEAKVARHGSVQREAPQPDQLRPDCAVGTLSISAPGAQAALLQRSRQQQPRNEVSEMFTNPIPPGKTGTQPNRQPKFCHIGMWAFKLCV